MIEGYLIRKRSILQAQGLIALIIIIFIKILGHFQCLSNQEITILQNVYNIFINHKFPYQIIDSSIHKDIVAKGLY